MAGPQVAEHALLLALGALRGISHWRSYIQSVNGDLRYQAAELGTESLYGRRVGLHGFGRIARSLVALLRPFGVIVCCYSAHVPPAFLREHGVHPCASMEELFSSSEVFFECEALTSESTRSVTADLLRRLPDGAVFVNVGRGAVVDEEALLSEAGRLRVALDVVTREPLDSISPWFNSPQTLLSPHIGGPTFDSYASCGQFALTNLHAFLKGRPVQALLSLADYDRST
ncbi:MAG: NAD(P)-dependent oxidoreductase [Verrucomicrobiota bacterium JB024]|nr:NAD(P)-dependent oxidoreductase [Verrucomicrobiota bacterium JB024]